ncbi:MAG: Tm-1-like ATP-binding domain-containing protein [Planctomycetales bacterium]|nr:Tm-1-like ATP-binding domain-containing protein [Planctomycetales bacterium]
MNVILIATLDTKGLEAQYVRDRLNSLGINVQLIDAGVMGQPVVTPDVPRAELFAAAGINLPQLIERADRGEAVSQAAQAVAQHVQREFAAGRVAGVIGLGGSAGTSIATAAMRQLPVGIPKVMVSTVASGDVRGFVGPRDIFMLYSVVDIAGLNRVTRQILANAADAMAGMVLNRASQAALITQVDRPLIAATMFGVTTPCIEHAKQVFESAGYEVLVFHATGSGGMAMEGLIRDGVFAGVFDITTTELADLHVGGVMSAGESRLTAAAECGVPQVVSLGATDMVNFWAYDTVPSVFRDRNLYRHNQNVTLMRTTSAECCAIADDLSGKLLTARGPYHVFLPAAGVSAIDKQGQPFDDPAARQNMMSRLHNQLPAAHVTELPNHINDAAFAEAAAAKLIALIEGDDHHD